MVEKPATEDQSDSSRIRASIREFRASIAPDLYSLESFIPWPYVDEEIARLAPATARLQALVDENDHSVSSLSAALVDEPDMVALLGRLLAAPQGVGFADGRELPPPGLIDPRKAKRTAAVLRDLGLWRLLAGSSRVEDLVRVALVAGDARRRGYRRTAVVQSRIREVVLGAMAQVREQHDISLTLGRQLDLPPIARGRTGFVILTDSGPIAAVNAVFQAATGGRQQRDLLVTYPNLQSDLDVVPVHLILIADGRGFADTPTRILETLFESVAACLTVRQAESGSLTEALAAALDTSGLRRHAQAPVDRLITSALEGGEGTTSTALPVGVDSGRLALARYIEEHPELALVLSRTGDELRWERSEFVARAVELTTATFDASNAIDLFGSLVSARSTAVFQQDGPDRTSSTFVLQPHASLPSQILVASIDEPADEELIRAVAATSLAAVPESALAVLLAPTRDPEFTGPVQRRLQAILPVNVVVIEPSDLIRMSRERRDPTEALAAIVLDQSDLTKASPFILSSATPERMFFGRENEEASLLATLASNSVALLGSRRIGKTSLMRHVESQLRSAGFAPFFMDCQTVRNWDDFGNLASRRWGIQVPPNFKPKDVLDMVSALAEGAAGPLVFLLDEVDQLLDWDQVHTEDEVPEAFFRACRTVSQEGGAQFVFSGERTIARKLWDPHSPHWNFCRPLSVQQLTRVAADHLLVDPLSGMQITIEDLDLLLGRAWDVTSGHPQLVQLLGDRLVRRLDTREGDQRSRLADQDLQAVVDTYEYREAYLETYWGQATTLEKLLSVWAVDGEISPSEAVARARTSELDLSAQDAAEGLRMLALYGVLEESRGGYRLRASWFPTALDAYGGAAEVRDQLVTGMR